MRGPVHPVVLARVEQVEVGDLVRVGGRGWCEVTNVRTDPRRALRVEPYGWVTAMELPEWVEVAQR